MLNKNASLSLTITPDAGYTLADAACWTVEMGTTMLTYGTGFTYNSSTNTFSIASVTGDVTILAEAGRQITWRAGGSVHATNVAAGDKITLPTDPDDCSATKKFVGWCTQSNYSHASTAPTFAKDGDTYSVATYYAVYATESTGSGGSSATIVERMSTSSPYVAQTGWTASAGGTYTSSGNYGDSSPSIKLSTDGNYVQSAKMDGAITAVSYWYKPQNATGSIDFYVSTDGSTFAELTAEKVEFTSSNTAGTKSITLSASSGYKAIKIVYSKTTSNLALDDISITYGGSSTSYSDYTTSCVVCTNTPTMSFASPTTVDKTTADASFTKTVTISGKGSGQTVAYSSSDETVATVNNSGLVTLQGKGGTTTITASVEANGTYCAAEASYTLNVTCALSGITLNTSSVKTEFAVGETFNSTGLVVTANYTGEGCPSGTVTPASVSSPDMSSAGTKTVTVTYNGKTATYQITVKASHTVTWMACGSQFKQETYLDGASLVLPSPAPGANTAGMSFAGWTTESSYTGATAPTLISAGSAVNADATYYAIYH